MPRYLAGLNRPSYHSTADQVPLNEMFSVLFVIAMN